MKLQQLHRIVEFINYYILQVTGYLASYWYNI